MQFRLRQVQVSRAVRCHRDGWDKETCKNTRNIAHCLPPSCVLWIYTLPCISRMTHKCFPWGSVLNCCLPYLPGTSLTKALQTQIEHIHSLPAFSSTWPLFLVSHSSFLFFFPCFSVSRNVIENKLTGQTASRFPLTRVMCSALGSERPSMSGKNWITKIPYSSFISEAKWALTPALWEGHLACWPPLFLHVVPGSGVIVTDMWWWWIQVQEALHIQPFISKRWIQWTVFSISLASALSIEKSNSCFTLFTQCTGNFTLASQGGRRKESSRNNEKGRECVC